MSLGVEDGAYEKYAAEHPDSPDAAEALYDAAWRYAALIEIYKTEDQAKKSEESKAKAFAVAQKVASQTAQVDWAARAQRLETLSKAEELDPLPVDAPVAHAWAALRVALRDAGLRMPINDSWIAATAIAHSMPVATQDGDYDGIPGVEVLRL